MNISRRGRFRGPEEQEGPSTRETRRPAINLGEITGCSKRQALMITPPHLADALPDAWPVNRGVIACLRSGWRSFRTGCAMTFGFFPTPGSRCKTWGACRHLDRRGISPGKVWAPAISVDPTRLRTAAGARLFTRLLPADRPLPGGDQCRALAGRQIFLEPARARIHADVDHRRALLPGPGRRVHFARPLSSAARSWCAAYPFFFDRGF